MTDERLCSRQLDGCEVGSPSGSYSECVHESLCDNSRKLRCCASFFLVTSLLGISKMTSSLSDEQQQEIAREGNGPIRVIHPTTQKEYVLLAADIFDRVKSIFDDEQFNAADAYAAQSAVAGAAGWDDPEMDVYDHYDANRPSP